MKLFSISGLCSILLGSGCIIPETHPLFEQSSKSSYPSSMQEVEAELQATEAMIDHIGGYYIKKDDSERAEKIAGVILGKGRFKKTSQGYLIEGCSGGPDTTKAVLRSSDLDGNHVVRHEELIILEEKVRKAFPFYVLK